MFFSHFFNSLSIIVPPEKKNINLKLIERILYNFWILISGAFTTGAAKHYGALFDIYQDIYIIFQFTNIYIFNQLAVNKRFENS